MSNLSAIGFDGSKSEGLEAQMMQALEQAREPSDLGEWASRHAWFVDSSGATIAAHLVGGKIACVTPFLFPADGGTKWRVRTSSAHIDTTCLHCSGADCDILAGEPSEMITRSAVQWLFFDAYADWLGAERCYEMQIVGFASALHLCSTDEEWEAAQAAMFGARASEQDSEPGKPMRLADQAFLPHGMFGNDGDLGARAQALVTGRVVSLDQPTNRLTGGRFTWIRVETLAGLLDVVAPFEGSVRRTPGMRALADVWLVGRPSVPPPIPPKRRSWWLKLVGKT